MAREHLFGRQPVRELLVAGRRDVHRLFVHAGHKSKSNDVLTEVMNLARERSVPVSESDPQRLSSMVKGGNHQGVVAETDSFPYTPFEELTAALPENRGMVLLLDHVEDPQNLGSLLRSADAAGVDGVIIPRDRAAPVSPAAVRASAGAAEHLRVCQVTNLVRSMKALQKVGLWLYGLEALEESQVYTDVDLSGAVGLVVGSEGRGMGRLVRETCDFLLKIPLAGGVSSLNAGVAGAVVLFEMVRQRSAAQGVT